MVNKEDSPNKHGDFHLHNSFAFWINRLNTLLQEDFNAQLKSYDVTWQQWLVLNILGHHKLDTAITPAHIAAQLGVDRSAVTRLLDRLVLKELVIREHDKLDRRSVCVSLTSTASQMINELNQRAYEHQQAFLTDLHRSERRGLKRELQKILRTRGVDSWESWQRAD